MSNRRGEQAEASQLMDIASMAALVKPQAQPPLPPPPARRELGPNLAVSRLTTHDVKQSLTSPSARDRDPRAPLYWMIACLNVVVLAMAAYVVFEEPAVIVKQAEEQAPAVVAAVDHAEEARTDETVAPEIPGAPQTDAVESSEPEPTTTSRRNTKPRARDARPPRTKTETPREPAPPASTKDVPIECIINPASCDVGRKKPTTEAQGPRKQLPAEDLPETLSQSALRNGFASVRSSAKACGAKHGAAPGENVEVKVSIAGGTGKVVSATPLGAHSGSALGKCVANALGGASFDRFAKAQIGLKYTVRL